MTLFMLRLIGPFSDAMAYRGDLIGCKLLYDKERDGKLPVSFTLNGRVVGEAEVSSTTTNYYAYVGMGWKGISLVFRVSDGFPVFLSIITGYLWLFIAYLCACVS